MARRISKKAALAALQAALKSSFADASDHADTVMSPRRVEAMRYYNGEPFGDEVDGRSAWVHTELRDVAQVCLTNLMRVFTSKTSRICEFVPRTPKDVEQARSQTDMANYVIDIENDGYSLYYNLIWDALVIPGGGIAHWHHEPQDCVEYEQYTGLDQAQAALLRDDPEVTVLEESVEVHFDDEDHGLPDHALDHLDSIAQAGQELPPPGAVLPAGPPGMAPSMPTSMEPMEDDEEDAEINPASLSAAAASSDDPVAGIMAIMPPDATIAIAMRIRRTTRGGSIKVQSLPPECFVIDRRAKDLDTASYCARREIRTVSDLVELGYDFDEVAEHAGADDTSVSRTGLEEYTRNQHTFFQQDSDNNDPAQRRVLFGEHFIRHDLDQDGMSELLRVVTVGPECHMLADPEPVSEIPFAQFVIDPTPHSAHHLNSSLFSQVQDIQLAKSQIMRDVYDGLAQSITPKLAVVEGQCNMDDLLNDGSILRQKQPGAIQAIQTTFNAGDALNIIQYLDDTKSQRTGISRNSQGLDADALQSTSALAVSQMTEAASARMEHMARNISELGFRRMIRGVGRLIRRHQNKAKMIKLREQWVECDPRTWTSDLDCTVTSGIGRGDDQKQFALLGQILALQEKLITTLGPSNPICGITNYRATLSDLANAGGIVDSSRYFREITPEIEKQMAAGQQKQPVMDQVTAFMQAESLKANLKAETDRYRLMLDAARAQATDDLERDKLESSNALKAAEMQARYGAQVNAAALQAQIDRERHELENAVEFAKHLTQPPAPPAGQPGPVGAP